MARTLRLEDRRAGHLPGHVHFLLLYLHMAMGSDKNSRVASRREGSKLAGLLYSARRDGQVATEGYVGM